MNIIQQPDDLCFSGNLKDLILSGVTGNIPFKLLVDDKVIVDEIYSPVSGMVRVNFKDVIDEYLSITVPGDEGLLEQTGGLKRFSMQVGLSIVNFTVIKGGINDQPSSGDFLRGRWLTRQPAVKETSEEQPEWLSCYVSEPLLVKIKGYLPGGSEERKLHDLQPGKLYTVNTSLGIVRDLLGSSVSCYDAWLENPAGARFSNVQRYRVVDRTPGARVYVFENTTGGIDTIAFTGKHGEKVTTEGTITTLENVTLDRAMDFSLVLSQNTGFIPSLDHARWLKGFLVSKQRYHVTRFGLKRIYLRESENDFTCNNLNSYTFEFQYSLQDIYDSYWEPEDLPPVDDPVDGFSITVGYHPADGSRGTTEPSGTVTLQPGEDLLVRMLPAGGCQVERFNVDQEEQPLANLYTFNNVREDHTMFVWFKQGDEPGEVYTDFLERSDQPGVYYSSVHSALDAIKSSYPGLDPERDVVLREKSPGPA